MHRSPRRRDRQQLGTAALRNGHISQFVGKLNDKGYGDDDDDDDDDDDGGRRSGQVTLSGEWHERNGIFKRSKRC